MDSFFAVAFVLVLVLVLEIDLNLLWLDGATAQQPALPFRLTEQATRFVAQQTDD